MTGDPVAPPAPRPRSARHVRRVDLGPLILSASAALPLSRLVDHGVSFDVLWPVLVAIVLADVVTAALVSRDITTFPAVGVGWVVSACGVLLVVDPVLFVPGSSHFLHLGLIGDQLGQAHRALANDGTPLPRLDGVVLVVGAIAGAAAALTRGTWARGRHGGRRALGPCMAPSLAIFIYSTLVSAERHRVAAFVSYFLGVVVFLALADRSASPVNSASRRGSTSVTAYRLVAGALASLVVVGLVVIAAGSGLSGMRLTVFQVPPPASTAGRSLSAHGAPQDLLTGLALVDDLLATEVSKSKVVIFRARSPVTTYWQVGTLSSFTGSEWLPTTGTSDALSGTDQPITSLSPGTLPSPSPGATFSARVSITDFVSRLLPAPPDTISVRGLDGAAPIDEDGVLASSPSGPGTTYTVTAGIAEGLAPGGSQLASDDPRLVPYLALPTQPAIVSQLAHQAAGGATTAAAEAQALVNWFRSGRFRYTLSPPATSGPDPLVQFLTVTKAGFCEQFAGAYAVLARSLGIPTRLAVGFTAGQVGTGDTFTVTGGDAHVWPQVYLGPDAGWVSVEPTPPGAGQPVPSGVLEPSGTAQAQTPVTTTTGASTPTSTTSATPGSHPSTLTPPAKHRGSSHLPAAPRHHGPNLWILVLVVAAALGALALAVRELRHRRSAAEAVLHPDQGVVRAWERALGALRHMGLPRHEGETPAEYAARIRAVEGSSSEPVGADAVSHLAALVELACYTGRPCTPGQADQALALASTVVTTNRSHRFRPRRGAERHETGTGAGRVDDPGGAPMHARP